MKNDKSHKCLFKPLCDYLEDDAMIGGVICGGSNNCKFFRDKDEYEIVKKYNFPHIIENKSCFNCKHHFFSDMYLECNKNGILDTSTRCNMWEEMEEKE